MVNELYASSTNSISGSLMNILPFVLIFGLMYFLIFRPQNKREKARKEAISNIVVGDEIVTSGGIIAKVTKLVNDLEVLADLSVNTEARILRNSVVQVNPKNAKTSVSSKDGAKTINKKLPLTKAIKARIVSKK